jgi:hypothetical protein
MQQSSPAKARPSWPDPWRCTVELLVVSGCPGTSLSVARIREATEQLGLETNLRFVIVDDVEQATALGFKGSPTVRVEGEDVDQDADSRPVGLSSRLYPRSTEAIGTAPDDCRAPPLEWIRAALARSAPLLDPRSASV